jgi:hypothetical protein
MPRSLHRSWFRYVRIAAQRHSCDCRCRSLRHRAHLAGSPAVALVDGKDEPGDEGESRAERRVDDRYRRDDELAASFPGFRRRGAWRRGDGVRIERQGLRNVGGIGSRQTNVQRSRLGRSRFRVRVIGRRRGTRQQDEQKGNESHRSGRHDFFHYPFGAGPRGGSPACAAAVASSRSARFAKGADAFTRDRLPKQAPLS